MTGYALSDEDRQIIAVECARLILKSAKLPEWAVSLGVFGGRWWESPEPRLCAIERAIEQFGRANGLPVDTDYQGSDRLRAEI